MFDIFNEHHRNSYTLNLVHGYEIMNDYQHAFEAAKRWQFFNSFPFFLFILIIICFDKKKHVFSYLHKHRMLRVGKNKFTNETILSVIRGMSLVSQSVSNSPLRQIYWIKASCNKEWAFTPCLEEPGILYFFSVEFKSLII